MLQGDQIVQADNEQEGSSDRKEVYPGDISEAIPSLRGKLQCLDFESPALMLATFNEHIRSKTVVLHKWQVDMLEELGLAKPTQAKPIKYCLVAANGSGKDAFIVAPFAVWFILCKIQSRVILTSSSGTQLTAQTETYIRDLAELINNVMGQEIFRIRQRYIKCRLSGSEIRMFATDEKGKAEGYHPMVPNAEMAIVVNEGKSVTEDIHSALRRCTGYNYWLEVSTPGEPTGFFYNAATSWKLSRRVTSYDCAHLSEDEREEDKRQLGEHSALFRSKHLALFTSIGGEVIITQELIDKLRATRPLFSIVGWKDKVGIDLAAGGDENCVYIRNGLSIKHFLSFRETDTTLTADKIEMFLLGKVPKDYDFIFADDGGVGHAIIDTLVRRGWNIKRVLNQHAAINKRNFGNKGAENWYRVKRIFEEGFFDLESLPDKEAKNNTLHQLINRKYKQQLLGARIFLESKKEAKAHGRPSPDRADALILTYTGETLDDFLKAKTINKPYVNPLSQRSKETRYSSLQEAHDKYTDEVTYGKFNAKGKSLSKRLHGSLKQAMNN